MPIDCNASYIDASEACDGRVLVCLQDTDGTPYFDRFDVDGGPATGVSQSTTGFTAGTVNPPYSQNYDVQNEPAGFQCFYINYIVGTQTSDTLIIQQTDVNNAPVGDACELAFNVQTETACTTTCTDTYNCINPTLNAPTGQDFCVTRQLLGVPFYAGNTCSLSNISVTPSVTWQSTSTCEVFILASNLPAVGSSLTVSYDVICCGAVVATGCTATINVTGDQCIPCNNVSFSNVSSTLLNAGDTLTFDTLYSSGPLISDHYPAIKDINDNEIAAATYVSTTNGVNSWSWTVPSPCVNASYKVCLTSANLDPTCADCPLFNVQVDCGIVEPICPAPVIVGCVNGAVSMTAGVPVTLSVTGCDCADSIIWTSTSAALSFNPSVGATTSVTASNNGSYQIDVECCDNDGVA